MEPTGGGQGTTKNPKTGHFYIHGSAKKSKKGIFSKSVKTSRIKDDFIDSPLSSLPRQKGYVVAPGADLSNKRLIGVDLHRAVLRGANLTNSDLSGAELWDADLREADLSGAKMHRSILRKAKMQKAVFANTDLWGADLRRANLCDTDLSSTRLDKALLTGAYYNNDTIFPRNFKPEEQGMVFGKPRRIFGSVTMLLVICIVFNL